MLGSIDGKETMFDFLCRGLEDLPGIGRVYYQEEEQNLDAQKQAGTTVEVFHVHIRDRNYGQICCEIEDEPLFRPYSPYIHNICFMTAVLLEERRQRSLNAQHRQELERRVIERTRELEQERTKALYEQERAEEYLEASEALIMELDTTFRIERINQQVEKVSGYSEEELLGRSAFEFIVQSEGKQDLRAAFEAFVAGQNENFAYNENPIRTRSDELRYISWHNLLRRDSTGEVNGILISGIDITERRRAEKEKDILLREVHHRTKNNMHIIISLLSLQMARIENPELRGIITDMRNRIFSMALVHNKLYSTESIARFDFVDYIRELGQKLVSSVNSSINPITFEVEGESIEVNLETAVPCALVINEILTNSIKHAFTEESTNNTVFVSVSENNAGITIDYRDTGKGLPEGFLPEKSQSLGMQIIHRIIQDQLSGSVRFDGDDGLRILMSIKRK